MKTKILCVDDEMSVLAAQKRLLRKYFDVSLASAGEDALTLLKNEGPFAVVIADRHMPGMDGIQFLSEAKKLSPDTVRLMLTGDQHLQSATQAVNEGNVFRFLNKPCPPDTLAKAIKSAVEQNRLIRSEKELLEQTLGQTVKVLVELLSLTNPHAFSKASRIQRLVRYLVKELCLPDLWKYETAAMLSQIGCISISEDVLIKKELGLGHELTLEEQRFCRDHPLMGAEQISKIPRMEEIAEIVRYQNKGLDGSGVPLGQVNEKSIPLGARLMKITLDYDAFKRQYHDSREAFKKICSQKEQYDPMLFLALETIVEFEDKYAVRDCSLEELDKGMILVDDVMSQNGLLLACQDQELSDHVIQRLINFSFNTGVILPIKVKIPEKEF